VTGATPAEQTRQRAAAIDRIETECKQTTGLNCQVVSLYQGGIYSLYRYKRYTDLRLVMAPEEQIAAFGGDPDNFTYPRYDLDFALFRVYENDAPIRSDHFLKWNAKGAAENELVFVTGHPGSTDRDDTVAELETERDIIYPANLQVVKRRIAALRQYASRGAEQARQASGRIFGLENALKAYIGEYNGLLDAKVFAKKTADERALRDQIGRKPEWKTAYGGAWTDVQRAQETRRRQYKTERSGSFAYGIRVRARSIDDHDLSTRDLVLWA